jgi:hypothetical protein
MATPALARASLFTPGSRGRRLSVQVMPAPGLLTNGKLVPTTRNINLPAYENVYLPNGLANAGVYLPRHNFFLYTVV